ncbi:hypothetical protein VUR80DRAFT_8895 [Thermomyces stellatus]
MEMSNCSLMSETERKKGLVGNRRCPSTGVSMLQGMLDASGDTCRFLRMEDRQSCFPNTENRLPPVNIPHEWHLDRSLPEWQKPIYLRRHIAPSRTPAITEAVRHRPSFRQARDHTGRIAGENRALFFRGGEGASRDQDGSFTGPACGLGRRHLMAESGNVCCVGG